MRITLLGPQRRPTVDQVVQELDPGIGFATVTAGWQERERDDDELQTLLRGRGTNLNLYGRWLDVQERDRQFAEADLEHRTLVQELRTLYLIRLESALGTIDVLAKRNGDRPSAIEAALADSEAVVRLIDDRYVARVREAEETFDESFDPTERAVIVEHRDAVRQVLEGSDAMIVAGGHVGVLLRVMRLFGLRRSIPDTVIAWSAGAMSLTEKVVLFHDRTPQGPSPAEIYDEGLAVIRGAVLLPHARRRLRVDDPTHLALLARRFAPATCVVLDDEVRVDLTPDGAIPPSARVIDRDGHILAQADE